MTGSEIRPKIADEAMPQLLQIWYSAVYDTVAHVSILTHVQFGSRGTKQSGPLSGQQSSSECLSLQRRMSSKFGDIFIPNRTSTR
jgi:hypothetical protein